MNNVDLIEKSQLRDDIPGFRPGDTVKVHVRVVEGTRERVQVFQGVVIRRQGGSIRETFTVRKISFGVGVERTFPLHSPSIAKIEIVSRGKVRRAKLYYLRDLRGKKARIKERREAEIEMVTTPSEEPEPSEPQEESSVEATDIETAVTTDAVADETSDASEDSTPEDSTPEDSTPEDSTPEEAAAPEADESAGEEPAGDEAPSEG